MVNQANEKLRANSYKIHKNLCFTHSAAILGSPKPSQMLKAHWNATADRGL